MLLCARRKKKKKLDKKRKAAPKAGLLKRVQKRVASTLQPKVRVEAAIKIQTNVRILLERWKLGAAARRFQEVVRRAGKRRKRMAATDIQRIIRGKLGR